MILLIFNLEELLGVLNLFEIKSTSRPFTVLNVISFLVFATKILYSWCILKCYYRLKPSKNHIFNCVDFLV